MEKNKTAVDYLFVNLWDTSKDKLNWYAILKEAKEIEKEQIKEAYIAGNVNEVTRPLAIEAEGYYKQTYESKTKE